MAKAKSKPAKTKSAFEPQVHVRMYRQGLGDCFLLRFETEKDQFFTVMIDCGIYKASPDSSRIMNEIVDDIDETTEGHIDVLVSTHEHWDHISGFSQALPRFEKLEIDQVWQAWTEDPKSALANKLRTKYEGAKAKLVGLMNDANRSLGATPSPALDEAFSVMGFFGIDKHGDEAGPYDAIKTLMKSKHPKYFMPGEVEELGDTGVKAFILGPPANEDILKKQDIAKGDAYEKEKTAFFDGFESMLGAVESGMEGNAVTDFDNRPFDRRREIPLEVARRSEFFQTLYAFDSEHPEWFRSIEDLAFDTLGNLALRMDNYINNTSLVIAFRLPSGQVLLFPGDAQGGNWKSWADPEKPLAFEDEKTNARELLANTVLYKVGHHGSHNATPRTYGLELMTHPDLRAFVPVDAAIATAARYGEMPLHAIMDALGKKPGGAVFRSDDDAKKAPSDVFLFSKKMLSIKTSPEGKYFDRPMYCETSFDLN